MLQFEQRIKEGDSNWQYSIGGKRAYIARFLVCVWYDELCAKYRYNPLVLDEIKEDYLRYIFLNTTKDNKHNIFLSKIAEGTDSEQDEIDLFQITRDLETIENALANAVGGHAANALLTTRSRDASEFDKKGDAAPEGHCWGQEITPDGNIRTVLIQKTSM